MAWALINSQVGGGAFNATGSDLLVVLITDNVNGDLTIQDSLGNTYTALTKYGVTGGFGNAAVRLSYKQAPTVSSTMTFSLLGVSGAVPEIFVMAFSGSASSPFEAENGASSTTAVTSIQPGAVTAANNNDLLVSGVVHCGTVAATINSGFTLSQATTIAGGVHYSGGIAWRVADIADGAINPTWTWSSNAANQQAATQALFKGAVAGGGGGPIIRGGQIMHGAIIRGGRIAA